MSSSLWLTFLLATADAADKPAYDHGFSLTISPIHLALPLVELTGEGRVADKVGVAGIAGLGTTSGYRTWEVGAQGRYYVLGDFDHGMQVGAEVLALRLSGDVDGVDSSGSGVGAGLFLGYKIAARFGLTFDAQVGAQRYGVQASASSQGVSASESTAAISPLLNLNLGWSF